MPWGKVTGVMNRQRLVDVCHDKVIELAENQSHFFAARIDRRLTRDFAPAANELGVLAGSSCKHCTALT